MIHGIPLDGKLFDKVVANEINNAYSTINDKIEKFESGSIYKKEVAKPITISSDDVSIVANYSFIAGSECTISLQVKTLSKKTTYKLTLGTDAISSVITAAYNKTKDKKLRLVINKKTMYIDDQANSTELGDSIYIQSTFLVF